MKLLRAEFQNYRLLRDLKLEFSSDPDKNLTVIRAANESGKTTVLHGLQWALYGDKALPNKGKDFRLYPIDWDESEGYRVPITATVEFEITTYRRIGGKLRDTKRRYRLVRSAFENLKSKSRSESIIKLFEFRKDGVIPINAPEALINEELPSELREIFFTDGDRALSFIEANVALSTKRDRVQRAIRSLLGLGVIEDAISHVQKSAREVNKKAKKIDGDNELTKIASDLETVENYLVDKERGLSDAKQQFTAFDEKLSEIDRKIAEALQKGDKEKLCKDTENIKREIKQLDEQVRLAGKEHSALFRSQEIATDLLNPLSERVFEKLEELHDQRKIPNATVPVLYDRISAGVCICGESLQPGDPDSDKRRAHILKLIDDNRRVDEIQKVLTDLYFAVQSSRSSKDDSTSIWMGKYKQVVKRRNDFQVMREEAGRKFKVLETQLDALPNVDIQGLRETQRQFMEQRDRFLTKRSTLETKIDVASRERDKLTKKFKRLLKEQQKGTRILTELKVIQDVLVILQNTYERITNEELNKVSELMNDIFLEMIGADQAQGAIIRQAEISKDFDIIVYGPQGRELNPDRDLNGASRRALTLAFILALTNVSEVQAPNVIDTPLGMTSGSVKRSILRTVVRESAQLILFLTHAEIDGCEEIIDEAAGKIFTLTNPSHYPKMLVNDPGTKERKILLCDCDHRSECQLCQRRKDIQIGLNHSAIGG